MNLPKKSSKKDLYREKNLLLFAFFFQLTAFSPLWTLKASPNTPSSYNATPSPHLVPPKEIDDLKKEQTLKLFDHPLVGCPENSACSKELGLLLHRAGTIIEEWKFELVKPSSKETKRKKLINMHHALESLRKNLGIPLSFSYFTKDPQKDIPSTVLWWDQQCYQKKPTREKSSFLAQEGQSLIVKWSPYKNKKENKRNGAVNIVTTNSERKKHTLTFDKEKGPYFKWLLYARPHDKNNPLLYTFPKEMGPLFFYHFPTKLQKGKNLRQPWLITHTYLDGLYFYAQVSMSGDFRVVTDKKLLHFLLTKDDLHSSFNKEEHEWCTSFIKKNKTPEILNEFYTTPLCKSMMELNLKQIKNFKGLKKKIEFPVLQSSPCGN